MPKGGGGLKIEGKGKCGNIIEEKKEDERERMHFKTFRSLYKGNWSTGTEHTTDSG